MRWVLNFPYSKKYVWLPGECEEKTWDEEKLCFCTHERFAAKYDIID